ncbi:hypothetical protein WJX77_008852 [Trebouxia sp. C0004]
MHYDPCAAPKQPPTVLPKPIKDALAKARVSWLKNTEVAQLLSCHRALGFEVSQEAPDRPPSGSLFLFNRKTLRFFRKDNHSWRKKADGKTVRETHEKLKVGSKDMLNCYYAHSDQQDGLQRRCYWLLSGDDGTVLVHYLASKKIGKTHTALPAVSNNIEKQIWDTAREDSSPENLNSLLYSSKNRLGYQPQLQDTCMGFEQGPCMTTAPDLDRPFSAAVLPPLPVSSGSKHRRALISISSSVESQRPSSGFGRANAMTNQSEFSYGAPDSLLSRPDSLLSDSDSQFRHCESTYVKPELARDSVLSRAYLPRRSVTAMPTNAADESTASLHNPSIVSGRVMIHSRTASAPSTPCSPGQMLSPAFDHPPGLVTPHRRLHSDVTNQSYAKPLAGSGSDTMAELPMQNHHARRSMDSARAGLHASCFQRQDSGPGLHPSALNLGARPYHHSSIEGQGSGTGLHQTGLTEQKQNTMQGLCPTALTGQGPTQMFSAQHLIPESNLPWGADRPSPMIQDEPTSYHSVHERTTTTIQDDPRLYHPVRQPSTPMRQDDARSFQSLLRHDTHTQSDQMPRVHYMAQAQDISQENLSSRAHFFSHDALAAQGTLKWPLAYPPRPSQDQYTPSQPNLRSLSQLLSISQAHTHTQMQSQPQAEAQLLARSHAEACAHANAQSHACVYAHPRTQLSAESGIQAYSSRHAQTQHGQTDALEYLRRSTVAVPPSWQPPAQLYDLEAAAALEQQQPTADSQSEAAFYTWMHARLKGN